MKPQRLSQSWNKEEEECRRLGRLRALFGGIAGRRHKNSRQSSCNQQNADHEHESNRAWCKAQVSPSDREGCVVKAHQLSREWQVAQLHLSIRGHETHRGEPTMRWRTDGSDLPLADMHCQCPQHAFALCHNIRAIASVPCLHHSLCPHH